MVVVAETLISNPDLSPSVVTPLSSTSSGIMFSLGFFLRLTSLAGGNGFASDTTCVSTNDPLWLDSASSLISKRNNPRAVSWRDIFRLIFVANNSFFSVSIIAPDARSRVFDNRKGVDPGTIATFNKKP